VGIYVYGYEEGFSYVVYFECRVFKNLTQELLVVVEGMCVGSRVRGMSH